MNCLHLNFLALALLATSAFAQDAQPATGLSADGWQLKSAARRSFREVESAKGSEHLESLLDLYRAEFRDDPSWRGTCQWSRRLAEVVHEYLRAGQLAAAMAVLGEAADLDVPLREGFDNGLAAAAGGWHRRLAALDSDERYELLYAWSMPTDARQTVRVLESFVPTVAPPRVFARVLGEHSRDSSFPIATVGGVPGLFSSAWELVQAANEAGRLRRLTAELEKLAEDQVANAEHVLTLARLAATDRRDPQREAELNERLSRLARGAAINAGQVTRPSESDGISPYRRAWQYGFGVFDEFEQQVSEFTVFPVWTGAAWQTTRDRPDPTLGFVRLDRSGGHTGPAVACIRRWTAPAAGVVSISGTLHHPIGVGDGVRARVVVGRSDVRGRWTACNSTMSTESDAIAVRAGDTIDFVVDMIENTTYDAFIWLVRLRLKAGETKLEFDSFDDFCGPHETEMLGHAVIAAACLQHEELQPIGQSIFAVLIDNTYDTDTWMNRPTDQDSPLLRPLLRRAWALAIRGRQGDFDSSWIDQPGVQHWIAAGQRTAVQHARGQTRHAWLAHEDHFIHLAGSGNDGLLLKYPLTGTFRNHRPAEEKTGFQLQLTDPGPWMRYRLAVQDGRMKVYCNGRFVHGRAVAADCDPWLAVRSHWQRNGGVRDVRISGDPLIPEQINLAVNEALLGWLPYFDEPMGIDSGGWHYVDGELRSPAVGKVSDLPAQDAIPSHERERLLHYHRPLLEDGKIEYEFYYEPERSHVHPAFDRLALVLDAEGVREHWATHGEYDEMGLDPANASAEPQHRRGPERLPLLPEAWNKVQLALAGDTIAVTLNGQLVYERPLEPTNLRTFGLFHDANRTSARMRNIIWRGSWPLDLPPVAQQELTDVSDVTGIDQQLAALDKVLDHDFLAGASDWFAVSATRGADKRRDVKITADGLQIIHTTGRGDAETSLGSCFSVGGDFDIRVSFDQLETQTHATNGNSHAGISVTVAVNNPEQHAAYFVRKQHPGIMRQLEMGHTWGAGDNFRHDTVPARIHDGAGGTFRFVRRKDTIYSMFADGDSSQFRIVAQYTIAPGEVGLNGIRLATHTWGGSSTQIVWKNVTIRAQRLAKISADLLAGTLAPAQGTPPVRYIRVDLPNRTQILSLAEVEVFSNGKNVAVGKKASQSSVDYDGSANLAIDGDRNGHYYMAGSVTHTKLERNPWWEVDLGQGYAIERVSIWNRSDHDPSRLAGFRVQLLDEKRAVIWEKSPKH